MLHSLSSCPLLTMDSTRHLLISVPALFHRTLRDAPTTYRGVVRFAQETLSQDLTIELGRSLPPVSEIHHSQLHPLPK